MNKEGKLMLWLSVSLVLVLIGISFFYFALFKPGYPNYTGRTIANPAEGMTIEEAVSAFDEGFVLYLLYSIKAYNLHNPPLSSDSPRMEIYVDDEIYNAVVEERVVEVSEGRLAKEDVIIKTTKEEAVRMIKDRSYVMQSFNDGKSTMSLVAGKTLLFAKGYLNLYNELTGKSITGNVIRIATD